MTKIIGKRKILNREECLKKLEELNDEMDSLRPYQKPKGKLLKFRTYDELYQFTITRSVKKQ